jgi:hypothetical protein
VDRNNQRDGELLALSFATVFVYRQIMGAAIEAMDVSKSNAILHGVAHALSNVTTIYGVSAENMVPKPLPSIDLMHGVFYRGATVLRTRNGVEFWQLSIRRADMRSAIMILKRAGATFGAGRCG